MEQRQEALIEAMEFLNNHPGINDGNGVTDFLEGKFRWNYGVMDANGVMEHESGLEDWEGKWVKYRTPKPNYYCYAPEGENYKDEDGRLFIVRSGNPDTKKYRLTN